MKLFLFPLKQVLLYPSFSKPFHVSETEYIKMIEDSIQHGVPIAIASVFESHLNPQFKAGEKISFAREIVGYGHPVIIEKHPNGSIVIFLEGKGKARLGRVIDSKEPYIVCEAEKLEEKHEIDAAHFGRFMTVHKVMIHWMNQHIVDDNARNQFLNYVKTPEQVIGCYASYLVADHDLQQLILESDDINEKISLIQRMIASGELVA